MRRARFETGLSVLGYVHTNPFSYASSFDPTKSRKQIQISASTLAFSTAHTSYEKTIRFRSPWETDYVHTVSFSLAFYIVLRPQGIRKQMKTLRFHVFSNPLRKENNIKR